MPRAQCREAFDSGILVGVDVEGSTPVRHASHARPLLARQYQGVAHFPAPSSPEVASFFDNLVTRLGLDKCDTGTIKGQILYFHDVD